MQDGFIKTAAATPEIKVADVEHNCSEIKRMMQDAAAHGAKVIVFPELCLTGYTCQDLFLQPLLLEGAKSALKELVEASSGIDALVFVGLPLEKDSKLYNVAAVFQDGKLLAFIPKKYLPNYAEFYEARHFTSGNAAVEQFFFDGEQIPFGQNILFCSESVEGLMIAAEICEDLWVPNPPSTAHALQGANLIINLSAGNEVVGKDDYRRMLVKATSARLICGYVYASAGDGESTQDLVFSGHNLIAENGTVVSETTCFENQILYGDIDIARIRTERRRMNTFQSAAAVNLESSYESMETCCDSVKSNHAYHKITVVFNKETCQLERTFSSRPFVPADDETRSKRCNQILSIQSEGLKKRFAHTNSKTAVIGISGGLDSTLALLVTARAFDRLGKSRADIVAVTMPCFGTTDRTYQNAVKLTESLGATLREIRIEKAVRQHFSDIGHEETNHNVVYENGQARERTQILMDIANQTDGLVIGTGDMSELALGWATYNGDHMSMYGVNVGVPKTLVRHLVAYYAKTCGDTALAKTLEDVLDTPVSPELLPPENGVISQKTEDLVGPYELHDFFLYYMLRCGFEPKKVYRIAKLAFAGEYDADTILKWEKVFYRRFFTQQFKRSCLPDGPKVGSTAVSPRGDLRMPSDAVGRLWQSQLENLS